MEYHPQAWTDLNATQRDICVILAFDGPAPGHAIDTARDTTTATESTTYKNLNTLEREGLVMWEDTNDPARHYHLTDDGADLVHMAVVETGHELAAQDRGDGEA